MNIKNSANNRDVRECDFVAHRVESRNKLLDHKCFRNFHKNPEKAKERRFWPLLPYCWIRSFLVLFSKKPFDVVDEFIHAPTSETVIRERIVLLKNYGWHFLPKIHLQNFIKARILKTVLDIQRPGKVVGLGALIKDHSLTQGGEWVVEQLGDRLVSPIVHGDTATAGYVMENMEKIMKTRKLSGPIALTGPTSKIGKVIAKIFSEFHVIFCITKDEKRFLKLQSQAKNPKNLVFCPNSRKATGCPLWVTGKFKPAGKKLLSCIPQGAAVLNFAVPNPLNKKIVKAIRPDLFVAEAGLVEIDPTFSGQEFTMRLCPEFTYACDGGTRIHAAMNWTHNEVGEVEIDQVSVVMEAGHNLGFEPHLEILWDPAWHVVEVIAPRTDKWYWLKIKKGLARNAGIFL